MLIERKNNPTVGDIVTIKLLSGEEIVGKITERTIDSVFLAKPVVINMTPVGPQQMGLTFLPVLGSVSDAIIQVALAAMTIRPILTGDDVKRNYIQATTGLVTATPHETSILTA
jgi:hypothetical protein